MAKYIVGDIFKGDFPISQYFGQRPEYYAQFGFKGHEGVDWATPQGVDILAPFDGLIIRDNDDPKSGAYGTHLVVWDKVQKCALWYCHLLSNSVQIGQSVKKGQVIGKTGNTGNTSGPHLHVNFVETDAQGNRLNLNNGYKGFLNILDSNLVKWVLAGNQPPPQQPIFKITDQTIIPSALNGWGQDLEVQQIRGLLSDFKRVKQELASAQEKLNKIKGIVL